MLFAPQLEHQRSVYQRARAVLKLPEAAPRPDVHRPAEDDGKEPG
jgi:hypothetical protein